MTIRDIVPQWKRETALPVRHATGELGSLHAEMNRLFNEFFEGFGMAPLDIARQRTELFSPKVNLTETAREYKVTAELPGMDEKDIEVSVDENTVALRGEKKAEHEDKTANTYRVERTYGSFERVIPLPGKIKGDGTRATFAKGILTITLQKAEDSRQGAKRIPIKTG